MTKRHKEMKHKLKLVRKLQKQLRVLKKAVIHAELSRSPYPPIPRQVILGSMTNMEDITENQKKRIKKSRR